MSAPRTKEALETLLREGALLTFTPAEIAVVGWAAYDNAREVIAKQLQAKLQTACSAAHQAFYDSLTEDQEDILFSYEVEQEEERVSDAVYAALNKVADELHTRYETVHVNSVVETLIEQNDIAHIFLRPEVCRDCQEKEATVEQLPRTVEVSA